MSENSDKTPPENGTNPGPAAGDTARTGSAKPVYLRLPVLAGAAVAVLAIAGVAMLSGPSQEAAPGTQLSQAPGGTDAGGDATARPAKDAGESESSGWELGRPGDIVMGSRDAPVKIIEYASLTCPACASFKLLVFPDIKKKYIDAGLVQYTLREFPTAPQSLAIAGFMLARCTGEERYYNAVEALFRTQRAWVTGDPQQARATLEQISRQFGLNETEFEACIQDEQELQRIRQVVDAGVEVYGINATPSFVVNGRKVDLRERSFEAFDSLIRERLPEGTEVPAYDPGTDDAAEAPAETGGGNAEADDAAADADASDPGEAATPEVDGETGMETQPGAGETEGAASEEGAGETPQP